MLLLLHMPCLDHFLFFHTLFEIHRGCLVFTLMVLILLCSSYIFKTKPSISPSERLYIVLYSLPSDIKLLTIEIHVARMAAIKILDTQLRIG
jgi:hypothetical protein